MKTCSMRPLLALGVLAALLLGERPSVLSFAARPVRTATPVAGADLALEPCDLDAHRAACAGAARELTAYGLDIEAVSAWTAFGLGRFLEAVEQLADAFGGGGERTRRVARFSLALGTAAPDGRITVVWQGQPQQRDGNPVRGGYAANRLYFNPNTLFLDRDTPEEAAGRAGAIVWWNVVHELAHLWDERSATAPAARYSARMQRWLDGQQAAGRTDERPSSYAITGGVLEAFAESVAATVTGDAAVREYYGSPRDDFVRTVLCEASACLR